LEVKPQSKYVQAGKPISKKIKDIFRILKEGNETFL
jgi:hypothetical protein